ncbi:hypothetical protein BDR06DRAFT_972336 [Suillus hirtellus]|nr:hypothetical protein BDR06DRAFT_972336 [Suillus hirtellus]
MDEIQASSTTNGRKPSIRTLEPSSVTLLSSYGPSFFDGPGFFGLNHQPSCVSMIKAAIWTAIFFIAGTGGACFPLFKGRTNIGEGKALVLARHALSLGFTIAPLNTGSHVDH